MPYIKLLRRKDMTEFDVPPLTPGELNFLITHQCIKYLGVNGLSYKTINDIIGALECAKIEFYRRKVAEYEDSKIIQNGDVYP